MICMLFAAMIDNWWFLVVVAAAVLIVVRESTRKPSNATLLDGISRDLGRKR